MGCNWCGEIGRFPNAMLPMRTACLCNSTTSIFGTFSLVSEVVATQEYFFKGPGIFSDSLQPEVGNLHQWVRNIRQETDEVVTSQVLTHSTQICERT